MRSCTVITSIAGTAALTQLAGDRTFPSAVATCLLKTSLGERCDFQRRVAARPLPISPSATEQPLSGS